MVLCLALGPVLSARRRRNPAIEDAVERAVKAVDRTVEFGLVKYKNSFKGFFCFIVTNVPNY